MTDQLTGIARSRALQVAVNEVLQATVYSHRPNIHVDIVDVMYGRKLTKAMDHVCRHMFVHGTPPGLEAQVATIVEAQRELDSLGFFS